MANTVIDCHQSCKGLCTSLESAAASEKKAIALYEELLNQCTYPEVRLMLQRLIEKRHEMLQMVEETRASVRQKFDVLEQVQASFDSP